MTPAQLDTQLERDLAQRRAAGLWRTMALVEHPGPIVRLADGRDLLHLASNDYLGLAQHPRLIQASIDATRQWGTGAAASRLITGTGPAHAAAEAAFAAFKHADAALLLPTGYVANLAVLTTLASPGDLICLDKLCHASLIDAARLSGATVRTYPHLNLQRLDTLLDRHRNTHPHRRRIVVSDTVFSMDGDVADLPTLCDTAERHDALIVLDEAHATGVLGPTASGLIELQHVQHRIHATISTASKALGGLGGLVTGSTALIDTLINHARPLIYTTGVPPAQAAALTAALDVVCEEPWRRERVLALSTQVREAAIAAAWHVPPTRVVTPIIPLITGDPASATALSQRLLDAGFLAPAIRPPTVPPNSARIRLSLRADLSDESVQRLVDLLKAPRG